MLNSVVELLSYLVKIPSVNPDGDPGTHLVGELKLAQALQDMLGGWGFEVALEEVREGRPNLIARAPGPKDRRRILFGPHLDTVGVSGMTVKPFTPVVEGGKLYGRGASDTKGPMAAMLWSLYKHSGGLADLPIAVDFVGFMGEESSQWGAKDFVAKYGKSYEFALVGEPTSLDLVYVTKGSVWAKLRCQGKAVHSSQPEQGENAIEKFMERWPLFKEKLQSYLQSIEHKELGRGTLNLGIMSGGTRTNVVPDEAVGQVDVRFIPGTEGEELIRKAAKVAGLEVISVKGASPMQVAHDNSWLEYLGKVAPNSKLVGAPWFSDAGHLNAGGLPAICVGPGSIEQAHTEDEFIKLSDLEEGAEWFSSFLTSLATIS